MSNHFTRYCYNVFVGCNDAGCRFAHYPAELRGPESMAEMGVRFKYPTADSCAITKSHQKPFIVRFDDTDDDEEYEQPSISLSEIIKDTAVWRQEKFEQARWNRNWVLKKAYYASMYNGEQDMNMSDDETEYGEQDMDLSD